MQLAKLTARLVVAAILVGLTACSATDDAGSPAAKTNAESAAERTASNTPSGDEPAAVSLQLTARDNTWTPTEMALAPGARVVLTVENNDTVRHSFTFRDVGIDTELGGAETYAVEFTAPPAGAYAFQCKYHPGMRGTVTVA